MKIKIACSLFFITLALTASSVQIPDSIQAMLSSRDGMQRISRLNELAQQYAPDDPGLAIILAVKARQLADPQMHPIAHGYALMNQATALFYQARYDSAQIYAQKALKDFTQMDDPKGMLRAYLLKGDLMHRSGKHNRAREYFYKALKNSREINDNNNKVRIYNNLGQSYATEGQLLLALKKFNKAMHVADSIAKPALKVQPLSNITHAYLKLGDYKEAIEYGFTLLDLTGRHGLKNTRAFAFIALGSAYKAINDYDKAMEFYAKALNHAQEQNNMESQAKAFRNIGVLLLMREEKAKATNYFKKALKLYNHLNNNEGKARVLNDLARAYYQLSIYNRALIFVEDAIVINQKVGAAFNLAQNYLVKGKILMQEGQLGKARPQLLQSFKILQEQQILDKMEVYKALADLYQGLNQPRKANAYLQNYISNSQKVQKARESKEVEAIKIEQRMKQHIREKETLRHQAQLKQAELEQQNLLRNVFFGVTVLLIVLIVLLVLFYRHRLKSYQKIREQEQKLLDADDELRKFRFVLNNANNAVVITDPEGTIEWISKAMTRIKGFDYKDIYSLKGEDITLKSDREDIAKIIKRMRKTGRSESYEVINYTPEGKTIHTHTTVTPVKNSEGEITNLVFIDANITEQKQIERELKKTLNTREKLLSIIAHDLRNSFNAIKGFAQLMITNNGKLKADKQLKYAENIQLAAGQGDELLMNLLHWGRAQLGGLKNKPENVLLHELASKNIRNLTFRAEGKHIVLINKVPEDLMVCADANMAETILRNLLSNAIKFTRAQGKVIIEAWAKKGEALVQVKDNGIGMSEEAEKRIFDDINFSTKGTGNEGGTGLGLVLCKEFVEKNHGRIWAESEDGKGSTFSFTLPLATPINSVCL